MKSTLLSPQPVPIVQANVKQGVVIGLLAAAIIYGLSQMGFARDFTSSTGQKIVAELVFVSGDNVTLKRPDGKTVGVPMNRFSDEDQKYILEWKKNNKGKVPEHLKNKKPRMDMRVSTGKTLKDDDKISGYIDEHKQKIHIKVSLENQDTVYPIVDAKLTILVIGRSPESGNDAIVYKKQFTKIELPLSEKKSYNGSPFELWYDDRGAMYGHKYRGYIVFLEDPNGKILSEVTIPGSAEKYLEAAKKLKEGDVFDKRYIKKDSVRLDKSVRGVKR